jgi:ATP-dependent Clp protease ATP-binding subunit ClpC
MKDILQIVDLMLSQVRGQLMEKGIWLDISDAAKRLLGDKGYDPLFGARPLRRLIQNMVDDPLSEALLQGQFQPGETVLIDAEGEEIVFRSTALVSP